MFERLVNKEGGERAGIQRAAKHRDRPSDRLGHGAASSNGVRGLRARTSRGIAGLAVLASGIEPSGGRVTVNTDAQVRATA